MISTPEEAYQVLAKGVLDFVQNRSWEFAVCQCQIFNKMASTSCYLVFNGIQDKAGLDWPDSSIDKGGAALFLRNDLLKNTGEQIWGLTFTLYPDGKFKLDYDYSKPANYVDEAMT